ncbi:MAG: PAS domain-containing protein, partial [Myxococcales bacterium]|nr:PAS domain-containing protein [Myxococcales bacterium]
MTGSNGVAWDELAQRELLLAQAEHIVHLGSWMWNTETNAIRWSDEMYRILGYEARTTEPSVELFFGAIHPEDRARVEEVAARGVATRAPEPVDFRLRRTDGSIRHVHMEGAVVQQDGPLRIVGTVLDVSEQRAVAARLLRSEKMEAVGTLAGGIAHDFSNYLQVILAHARVMAGNPSLDARAQSSIEQITVAAGRCDRLTRELLSFARRTTLKRERIDVRALVDRAIPLVQTLVGSTIRVVHEKSGPGPLFIEADEASLEQALMNLATNARDAMTGGGTLTFLTTVKTAAPDEHAQEGAASVHLIVKDNGCGMSPAVVERVFEPFYTTKESGLGTGLGLASVFGLVQQLGGAIHVESQEGIGSAFHLRFPRAVDDGSVDDAHVRGYVLVVEDQDAIRGLVRDALDLAVHRQHLRRRADHLVEPAGA